MNIPLNIDIQQILLHLLNFTILAGGLYILLYNPVKAFMDKRKEYYQGLHDEATKKVEDADNLKNEYENRLKDVEKEILATKQKANEDAKVEANKKLENARAEGEKIIAKAKAEAEYEKEKIIAGATSEIDELVGVAIDKMLQSQTGDAIDDFLAAKEK